MRTELVKVVEPDVLLQEELDAYLDRGWYRIGRTMMTCKVLWFDDVLRSAMWTRLDLRVHRFKKSHRKLMSQLERRFQVEIGPGVIDPEREALYQRYRVRAYGERSETLEALRGARDDLFDTWEIRIRDPQGRLVAFSWYDLGRETLQSIVGVYDPGLRRHSLGFATMLFEVRDAMRRGMRHYYPGYVMPGAPSMDYKLRLGAMEFWDFGPERWRPLAELSPGVMPDLQIRRALSTLRGTLTDRSVLSRQVRNRLFELPAYHPQLTTCLAHPLALICGSSYRSRGLLVAVWDLGRRRYSLLSCSQGVIFARDPHGVELAGSRKPMLMVEEHLGDYDTAPDAADAVAALAT